MEKGWQLTLRGGSCNVMQGQEEDEEDFMEEEDGEGMAAHVARRQLQRQARSEREETNCNHTATSPDHEEAGIYAGA